MQITKISMMSGNTHTMELDVTEEQMNSYTQDGLYLQDAFPHLSPADREFIKTGITGEEWDSIFGGMEDEEDEEDEEYDYE